MWPGEIAQCDFWFPPIELPVGFGQARTPSAAAGADDGDRLLPVALGDVDPDPAGRGPVRRLVAADRGAGGGAADAGLGRRGAIGRNRGGRVELTGDCQAFRGVLGTKVIVLQAGRAGAQGHHRTRPRLPGALLPARPGLHRPGDFNTQLQGWLAQVNARRRRALGCAPTDRIGADRQAMLTLPPVAPADRVAVLDPAGPRPLRPPGLQRLLGPPRR